MAAEGPRICHRRADTVADGLHDSDADESNPSEAQASGYPTQSERVRPTYIGNEVIA